MKLIQGPTFTYMYIVCINTVLQCAGHECVRTLYLHVHVHVQVRDNRARQGTRP